MSAPQKPVAIFRHNAGEGPAYFATFLEHHSRPYQLIKVDEGEAIPTAANAFSGLCFMGGPMSVNDDLPWISQSLALIRDAVRQDIPVIGHCLGGQLMSKALGGTITQNRAREIGWGEVQVTSPLAATWLREDVTRFEVFHWHGETFSIPAGAERILSSAYCDNQAFVMGPHLAMQCHVEMTETAIETWNRLWGPQPEEVSPSVQATGDQIAHMGEKIQTMRQFADLLYGRWIQGLKD